jgi:3-oxoadipate enol-lactonase
MITMNSVVEHKQLQRSGCAIHYFVSGQVGNPLIVFVHPAFADHRAFDHQLDYFAPNYRIVTLDLLGHGLSRYTGSQDKIDASAEHICTILDDEGYQRAHLVGVSLGSLIAQYVALRYPDRVASLTVLGGYNINADSRAVQKAQNGEMLKWLLRAMLSMNSLRRHVASVSLKKPEEQAKFYEMAQGFHFRSFMAMQGMGKVIQSRDGVQRTYPLFLACGDQDLPLAHNAARAWHGADPGSELQFIKDAGHCANMDQPEEFNAALAAFLTDAKVENDSNQQSDTHFVEANHVATTIQ